ncbi:MAG: peptidyl-prolyl cis-trans isomerase [Vicinamibacterales bacterium]
MTMLDRMRRHQHWLKWVLALVVLAFIVFYIPDFLGVSQTGVPMATDNVAEVEGRPIRAVEFTRAYNTQLQAYRNQFGGQMSDSLLKQMGLDRQILQQLVDERASLAEADRLGITATDAEVRERILTFPGLQENNQFIGEERYRQVLAMQNPPLTVRDFEDNVRQSIVIEKLRVALTGWISVSEADIDNEFRRRNEKVNLQIVTFAPDKFREGLQATDQELSQYFDAHKADFQIGERRKIRYVLIDPQKLRERVTVTPRDVESYYNTNIDQFSTGEQVRASHILIKAEGRSDADAQKLAQEVLAKVRAGGDFAALATQYSEDEGSKVKGGDLDFFPRGRMVPEFDQVAFSMQPGIVSDLVKTQFGYHIIKLMERKPSTVQPIDGVRDQITELVKNERVQTMSNEMATRIGLAVKAPADFDAAAKPNGLTVQESPFFSRTDTIEAIGPAPEVTSQAFLLEEGQVSEPLRATLGTVIMIVTGKEAPRTPGLEEVKERVREAVIRAKAIEAARAKATSVLASLKEAGDFEAAAKKAGLDLLSTPGFVARDSSLPGLGISPVVDAFAFGAQAGQVSDVLSTDLGVAVVKVVGRQDVTDQQLKDGRAALREELLNDRRSKFFSSYMAKAKQKMDITIDREALSRLVV